MFVNMGIESIETVLQILNFFKIEELHRVFDKNMEYEFFT